MGDKQPREPVAMASEPAPRTPVTPRPAATIVLVRGGSETLEVLLVQRTPSQRFMGGAWVFPGGAIDAADATGDVDRDAAERAAAIRELREEAGIEGVEPGHLVRYSRWITPPQIPKRFDTHFFLAPLPAGAEVTVDGDECVDHTWRTPSDALDARRSGELTMFLPTVKHLEQFAAFASADALLDSARGRSIEPVTPIVVGEGAQARIVLPGEPGYDAAG